MGLGGGAWAISVLVCGFKSGTVCGGDGDWTGLPGGGAFSDAFLVFGSGTSDLLIAGEELEEGEGGIITGAAGLTEALLSLLTICCVGATGF
jgi:hypothetical protein